jgi:type I restriction enzyme R subunit
LLQQLPEDGVGESYLIQHSAGSGKSNTIAWLAHQLSGFYPKQSEDRMFDSIIVVTDRRVLDRQLQNNIAQFEQVTGVVEAIDEKKSSQDLKKAIEDGKTIIISTLQKFSVIVDSIKHFPARNYAVIIDEAHSSQTGDAARDLRKSLSLEQAAKDEEEEVSLEDKILEEISKTGKQPNLSFFAFTATPKNKTIELFGTLHDGRKVPFDKYSMEQAIKEHFIKDVLQSYTSFKRYYKLAKRPDIDDKEYETKKTVRLLNNYVDLQDDAIESKSRIMLEHFVAHTQKEIQGKARAMLVTKSRLHAIRYKRKFDELMREMKLPYGALVAFSGTIHDDETGQDYTEGKMNDLGGRIDITDALKLPQHRILIVANKYQTGFDEPLLHTMFVDKKLGGVNTVQTLSRLNRSMSGKDSTMVLDFVNDPENVREDFQEYYVASFMEEENQTDPNKLYDLQHEIEDRYLLNTTELDRFAQIFFLEKNAQEKLQGILTNAKAKFHELEEEAQDETRKLIQDFIRLYRFLSQIIKFKDVDLEKWYVFLVSFIKMIQKETGSLPIEVMAEVQLANYKVQKAFTTSLVLESNEGELYGQGASGGGGADDDQELLSKIIKVLNDSYGGIFSEDEKKEVAGMSKQLHGDAELMGYFNKSNSKENIKAKFDEKVDDIMLQFVNNKLDLYNKLTEDKTNSEMKRIWFNSLYDQNVKGVNL